MYSKRKDIENYVGKRVIIKMIDEQIKEIDEAIKTKTFNEQFDLGFNLASFGEKKFLNALKIKINMGL